MQLQLSNADTPSRRALRSLHTIHAALSDSQALKQAPAGRSLGDDELRSFVRTVVRFLCVRRPQQKFMYDPARVRSLRQAAAFLESAAQHHLGVVRSDLLKAMPALVRVLNDDNRTHDGLTHEALLRVMFAVACDADDVHSVVYDVIGKLDLRGDDEGLAELQRHLCKKKRMRKHFTKYASEIAPPMNVSLPLSTYQIQRLSLYPSQTDLLPDLKVGNDCVTRKDMIDVVHGGLVLYLNADVEDEGDAEDPRSLFIPTSEVERLLVLSRPRAFVFCMNRDMLMRVAGTETIPTGNYGMFMQFPNKDRFEAFWCDLQPSLKHLQDSDMEEKSAEYLVPDEDGLVGLLQRDVAGATDVARSADSVLDGASQQSSMSVSANQLQPSKVSVASEWERPRIRPTQRQPATEPTEAAEASEPTQMETACDATIPDSPRKNAAVEDEDEREDDAVMEDEDEREDEEEAEWDDLPSKDLYEEPDNACAPQHEPVDLDDRMGDVSADERPVPTVEKIAHMKVRELQQALKDRGMHTKSKNAKILRRRLSDAVENECTQLAREHAEEETEHNEGKDAQNCDEETPKGRTRSSGNRKSKARAAEVYDFADNDNEQLQNCDAMRDVAEHANDEHDEDEDSQPIRTPAVRKRSPRSKKIMLPEESESQMLEESQSQSKSQLPDDEHDEDEDSQPIRTPAVRKRSPRSKKMPLPEESESQFQSLAPSPSPSQTQELTDAEIERMSCRELRQALKDRHEATKGKKAELQQRLRSLCRIAADDSASELGDEKMHAADDEGEGTCTREERRGQRKEPERRGGETTKTTNEKSRRESTELDFEGADEEDDASFWDSSQPMRAALRKRGDMSPIRQPQPQPQPQSPTLVDEQTTTAVGKGEEQKERDATTSEGAAAHVPSPVDNDSAVHSDASNRATSECSRTSHSKLRHARKPKGSATKGRTRSFDAFEFDAPEDDKDDLEPASARPPRNIKQAQLKKKKQESALPSGDNKVRTPIVMPAAKLTISVVTKMKKAELKGVLKARGYPTTGLKPDLYKRLCNVLREEEEVDKFGDGDGDGREDEDDAYMHMEQFDDAEPEATLHTHEEQQDVSWGADDWGERTFRRSPAVKLSLQSSPSLALVAGDLEAYDDDFSQEDGTQAPESSPALAKLLCELQKNMDSDGSGDDCDDCDVDVDFDMCDNGRGTPQPMTRDGDGEHGDTMRLDTERQLDGWADTPRLPTQTSTDAEFREQFERDSRQLAKHVQNMRRKEREHRARVQADVEAQMLNSFQKAIVAEHVAFSSKKRKRDKLFDGQVAALSTKISTSLTEFKAECMQVDAERKKTTTSFIAAAQTASNLMSEQRNHADDFEEVTSDCGKVAGQHFARLRKKLKRDERQNMYKLVQDILQGTF
eukprot:g795.t1